MIQLVWAGASIYPRIFCDSCGDEISKAKEGAVVYPNFGADGDKTSPRYVHKSFIKAGCMDKAEKEIVSKGGVSGTLNLGEHVAYLTRNVELTPNEIQKILARPGM